MTTDIESTPLEELMARASAKRDAAHGRLVSYSRKVFIPLTKLCRDVCHYCTFAERPRAGRAAYLSPDAGAGHRARRRRGRLHRGVVHARRQAGTALSRRTRGAGGARASTTTIDYLREMCALVLKETGLLPHVNPGIMTRDEIASLREVSASMGIMLESSSERLCEPGGVHYGSPDKAPAVRLEMMRLAGELAVPFTTGILIGIGETRAERLESLLAIARSARALRPHPGSDRAELPRQARHQAGDGAGTRSRRPAVDASPRRG